MSRLTYLSTCLVASIYIYHLYNFSLLVPAAADIKKYGDKDYEMIGGEADVPVRSPDQGLDVRSICWAPYLTY